MPWEDKTVEKLRKEFVDAAKNTENFSSLCREFGITRATGYKWVKRNQSACELSDRSHAPLHVPGKTPANVELQILKKRYENPGWGAKTILQVLKNEGHTNLPSTRTANNILKRNNCISEVESQKRQAYIRFQREHCNELWQMDIKGDFELLDGTRCYPFDIIDDRSRYCIGIFPKINTLGVRQSTELAFREYGLPRAILTDNGGQFNGLRGGFTQFERWLMDLDIHPLHGRPMHPQTQGKIERFHGTMKRELLNFNKFHDISDAIQHISEWRTKYNEIRPHEAIDMLRPADIYIPSERKYPDKIRPYEYSGMYRMLRVNCKGYLRFDGIEVYLSETMINAYLELRQFEESKAFLCYRNFKIAELDLVEEKLLNRRISRLD